MPRNQSIPEERADGVKDVRHRVLALLEALAREEHARKRLIAAATPEHRESARNLAHYLGLRQTDVSALQIELSTLGLSSLGRSEGHVRDTLLRLEHWLRLGAGSSSKKHFRADGVDRSHALKLLRDSTRALFGPQPAGRHVYVMVTAPSASEATRDWADAVIRAGADLIRINAAHETAAEWLRIVQQVRASSKDAGRALRVFIDLPGPKLRAVIRRTQASVRHSPRTKDRYGRTVGMTPVLFSPREGMASVSVQRSEPSGVPLPAAWFGAVHSGDRLRLVDASGRRRSLRVVEASKDSVRAETALSLYLSGGLPVTRHRGRKLMGAGRIGALAREPVQVAL